MLKRRACFNCIRDIRPLGLLDVNLARAIQVRVSKETCPAANDHDDDDDDADEDEDEDYHGAQGTAAKRQGIYPATYGPVFPSSAERNLDLI